ncbi:hypothetical protein R0K19_22895, partial [Bacillus sp. SIMBA_161]
FERACFSWTRHHASSAIGTLEAMFDLIDFNCFILQDESKDYSNIYYIKHYPLYHFVFFIEIAKSNTLN